MNFLNFNFTTSLIDLTTFNNQFNNDMDIYLIMIIALGLLAIGDLVVGVSNDAVNFLNSALGSKAISVRNIMILASLGVAVGAVFSSGMMEVGVEYGKIKNGRTYKDADDGHNRDGYSVFAIKSLKNNFEIYSRYDSISSNILTGQTSPWNNNNDGSLLIFGTQYQAVKGVKFNLNYRLFNYDNKIINNKSAIYLNAEFKI